MTSFRTHILIPLRTHRSQLHRSGFLALLLLVLGALPILTSSPALAQTSGVVVQIRSGGNDDTQQNQFAYLLKNTGSGAVSNLSVRIYFTLDGTNAASNYTLEKYYDQSGVAVFSGPTLASGSTYYYTVSYGTAALAAGGQWELQTALHLANWATTFSSGNDWYHTGYAVGALPASYTNTNYLPAYVSGSLAWGAAPGGTSPTATKPPATATKPPTTATTVPPTATKPPATATFAPPTNTPAGPTATKLPPTATPKPGTHVDNPYAGAVGYVNPDWSTTVKNAATAKGGTLGTQMAKVANYSTAVWLDRIAAINGTSTSRGLAGHLDAALAQQTSSGSQVVITVVVYDLPNRDCAALASNGELIIAQDGLNKYKTLFIDPIASVMGNAKYANVRIAVILEPDSLPNLVTNTSIAKCAEAQSSGAYVQGVQYAINKLHAIPNVYIYLDIAHSGWLGWDDNRSKAVTLFTQTVQATTAGLNSIDGFASNTSNYTPIQEPYLPDSSFMVGGQPLKGAKFYEWNPMFDEKTYDTAMYNAFVAAGFPSSIGMLVDTSRNGWGGANRPTGATGSTVDTYVNSGRIDRRLHRGNWCNQTGSGIGTRPTAAPLPHFDAFVWIKPPGESDGTSNTALTSNPDPMCNPNYTQSNGFLTGALSGSPLAGKWFEAEFEMLVQNAYPGF